MTPFMTLLYARAKELKRAGKTFKKPRFGSLAWLYPLAIEKKYANWLISLLNVRSAALYDIVERNINRMLREYNTDSDINDWEQTKSEFDSLEAGESVGTEKSVAAVSLYFASAISKFNDTQWQKFMEVSLGQKFHGEEPWAKSIIEEWKTTQLALIKGLEADQIAKIEEIIRHGVQNGIHATEVMKEIKTKIPQMSEYRSWLIARDQTTKLNSMFTKSRQIDAGFNRYEWITREDEKVRGRPGGKYSKYRPSHWDMNRKICLWSDPSVMIVNGIQVPRPIEALIGFPGMAINCRCMAMPIIDDAYDIINNLPAEVD